MASNQGLDTVQRVPVTGHFIDNPRWTTIAELIWSGIVFLVLLAVLAYGFLYATNFYWFLEEEFVSQAVILLVLVPVMTVLVASGGIDLSVGVVCGIVPGVIALSSRTGNPGTGFLVGMILAFVIGSFNGALVGVARVHPVIATLGMMTLFLGIECPHQVPALASLSSPMMSFLVLLFSIVGGLLLVHLTPFCRRPDPRRAWIARAFHLGTPYVLSSIAAGLVGAILAGRPDQLSPGVRAALQLNVVLAVVLGGTVFNGRTGNVLGGMLAVFVITAAHGIASNTGISEEAQWFIRGFTLLCFGCLSTVYYRVVEHLFQRSLREGSLPEKPSHGIRLFRMNRTLLFALISIAVVSALIIGYVVYARGRQAGLSPKDANLNFGEKALSTIIAVDGRGAKLTHGYVRIEDNRSTSSMPGAVFVVCTKEPVGIGEKVFHYREIVLLTSKLEYVLAPPGTVLTISKEIEILGRRYKPGTFVVPEDSKMPEG